VKKDRTKNPGAGNRDALKHAQTLADFSNLDATTVDQFQRDNPDFVPDAWLEYRAASSTKNQWEVNRDWVREMWSEGFPDNLYLRVRLLLSVFDPATVSFPSTKRKPLLGDIDDLLGEDYYPHQRGVLFLFEQPWRARFCAEPECGKRFVAAEPKTKYCSEACTQKSRNRQRMAWWNAEGRERREFKAKQQTRRKRRQ